MSVERARTRFAGLAALVLVLGCAGSSSLGGFGDLLESAGLAPAGGSLDAGTIAAGLKEALRVGTANTVAQTSALDGFLGDPAIRIGLPDELDTMASALRAVGFASQVDELEVAMNRSAEQAAGEATDVFLGAIQQMTISDARGILEGGDTAATQYFQRTTSDELRTRFDPIVETKMQTVGLAQLYDGLVARYQALPIPKQPAPDLEGYVTDRALDGLFTVLGEQERLIRTDPSARVTDLLRTVFGS